MKVTCREIHCAKADQQTVQLQGWVSSFVRHGKRRTFADVSDGYSKPVQVVFEYDEKNEKWFQKVQSLQYGYCISVEGQLVSSKHEILTNATYGLTILGECDNKTYPPLHKMRDE